MVSAASPGLSPQSSTPHLLDKPEEVPVGGPHWRSLCGVQGASSTSPWGHLEKRETGHVQHLGVPSTDPSRTRSFTQLTGAGTSGTSRRNGPGSRRCRACRHIGCCGRLGRDSAPPGLRARGEVALTQPRHAPPPPSFVKVANNPELTHKPGADQVTLCCRISALPCPASDLNMPKSINAPPADYDAAVSSVLLVLAG